MTDEGQRNGFLLYLNQKEIIDELTDQEAGIIFKAIFDYVKTKKVPKLNKMLKLVFLQIKNNLDNDEKRYNEKCAKNKENIKRYWEKQKQKNDTNEYDRIQTYTNNNTKVNNNNDNNINTNSNTNNNNNKDICNRATLDNIYTPLTVFKEVVGCFNKIGVKEDSFKTKKEFSFKNTKTNQQLIQNILDKGYTKEDIFDVIFLKYDQWIENNNKNKMDMSTYYRPSTVLGDKFEEYLQEAKMKEIS